MEGAEEVRRLREGGVTFSATSRTDRPDPALPRRRQGRLGDGEIFVMQMDECVRIGKSQREQAVLKN